MKKSVYTLLQSKSKTWSLQWFTSLFFLALFAFPLFPLKVTNVILIAFSASTLISFLIHPIPIKKIVLHNLVFVIPFLPYLIEYSIFSFNPEAHFEFEKKLFFFTAPFFIPVFIQITGFKNYRLPLMIFAISLCVLTTYTLLILSYKGIPFINTNYENGTYILRENFERISGLHPTYYSIFALSSACCLLLHFATSKTWLRLLSIFLAIMLVITVLLLAVKIAFITIAVLKSLHGRLKGIDPEMVRVLFGPLIAGVELSIETDGGSL